MLSTDEHEDFPDNYGLGSEDDRYWGSADCGTAPEPIVSCSVCEWEGVVSLSDIEYTGTGERIETCPSCGEFLIRES